jgi:flagellar biosynthetic protein FlhB
VADRQTQTEAPTQKRRDDARKKGDVAVSRDLTFGFGLLAATGVFMVFGQAMGSHLFGMVRRELLFTASSELNPLQVVAMARSSCGYLLAIVAAVTVAILVTHVFLTTLQVGVQISTQPLSPNWDRLNPVNGWGKLFSSASAMRGAQGIAKIGLLLIILWMTVRAEIPVVQTMPMSSLEAIVGLAWKLALKGSMSVSVALIAAGILDYGFQRWRHTEQLKMSKQEIKDERKDDEGDPHLKARIKRVQREMSSQRMLLDVPSASVVLTNPTHYSIALKYESGMVAPRVVAKGADEVAKQIRELAKSHGVPVLERPALTRALYRSVEVGQDVPPDLYKAVAEIVAYLYRIGRFQ